MQRFLPVDDARGKERPARHLCFCTVEEQYCRCGSSSTWTGEELECGKAGRITRVSTVRGCVWRVRSWHLNAMFGILRLLKLNGSTVWRSGTRSSSAIKNRISTWSRPGEKAAERRSYPSAMRDSIWQPASTPIFGSRPIKWSKAIFGQVEHPFVSRPTA